MKQTKETTEQGITEQLYCADPECSSRRLQLISIIYNSKKTDLNLLCLNCGLLLKQQLKIGVQDNTKPTTKKLEGDYYG